MRILVVVASYVADGCDDFGEGVDVVGFGAIVGVVLLLIQPGPSLEGVG